jgi:hypothetical protein
VRLVTAVTDRCGQEVTCSSPEVDTALQALTDANPGGLMTARPPGTLVGTRVRPRTRTEVAG